MEKKGIVTGCIKEYWHPKHPVRVVKLNTGRLMYFSDFNTTGLAGKGIVWKCFTTLKEALDFQAHGGVAI